LKYTDGYALWCVRDYVGSALYNGFFQVGMSGWTAEGPTDMVDQGDGDMALVLRKGSSIRQVVTKERVFASMFWGYDEANLCLWAKSLGQSGNLRIQVNSTPQETIGHLPSRGQVYCLTVPVAGEYTITLSATEGDVLLDDLKLYAHVQETRLYDRDERPGAVITAIRQLNQSVENRLSSIEYYDRNSVASLEGAYSDHWIGAMVRGSIHLPENLKDHTLRLKTYLPAGWPVQPVLTLTIGDQVFEIQCTPGLVELELPIDSLLHLQGQSEELQIAGNPPIVPSEWRLNNDKRALVCQVLELGFKLGARKE
jgi:hypothetical protein